jgi:transcriptional regulator with XRE-family HTH domain
LKKRGIFLKEQELRAVLSENIKQYRTYNKLSQLELANSLDISTNFLSDIERCKTWVSPRTLVKLAGAFHIEPYELLKPVVKLSLPEKDVIDKYAVDTLAAVQCAMDQVRIRYLEVAAQVALR